MRFEALCALLPTRYLLLQGTSSVSVRSCSERACPASNFLFVLTTLPNPKFAPDCQTKVQDPTPNEHGCCSVMQTLCCALPSRSLRVGPAAGLPNTMEVRLLVLRWYSTLTSEKKSMPVGRPEGEGR